MPAFADLSAPLLASAFDAETSPWPAHGGQLFGVAAGALTVEVADGLWVVPPGHAAWVPPQLLRHLTPHGPCTGWRLQVGEAACVDLPGAACVTVPTGLLREAATRASTWNDGPRDAPRWRIAGVILDELRALVAVPSLALPWPADAGLRAVAEAMREHLAHDPGLDHWAALAGVASRTLTRHFLAETGLSVGDWRQRARLLRALEGLAAGRAADELATPLGYDSVRTFTAMFRRETGVAPGRYFGDGAARVRGAEADEG